MKRYNVLVNGEDHFYKTYFNAYKKYDSVSCKNFKRILEMVVNEYNEYEYKTIIINDPNTKEETYVFLQ